ncbi:MAG: hypothetical protein H6765_11380 [Candidatus Peribacteria bacterium]|nr:MAG: hypothetical protein H6765_11380 [Candidatus Peribacteria bacterium]
MQAATGLGLMTMSLWKDKDELAAARDLKKYYDQEFLLLGASSASQESRWKEDGSCNINLKNAYYQPVSWVGNMYLLIALSA